ncbi:MAG: sensor histidine kinase [Corynebacteriales bacterium]|nr:sensor histidine kinase [Mycobacteriales bacterium]
MRSFLRWRALPVWVADGIGAAILLGVDLWFNAFFQPQYLQRAPAAVIALLVITTVPLAFRRIAPWTVFAVIAAGGIVSPFFHVTGSETGTLVGVYTIAAYRGRTHSFIALAGFSAVKSGAELWGNTPVAWVPVLIVLYLTAWTLGDRQQSLRIVTAQLRSYAERLEQEREVRVKLAAAQERTRIARELHDVVAHAVSVMVLHAGVARRVLPDGALQAEVALTHIESAGRQSLNELRRLLGVLRVETDAAQTEPQPKLADLTRLIEQHQTAGMPVRLDAESDFAKLDVGVQLCAYRIVQEALTNVLKHAQPTEVVVRIRSADHGVRIDVHNDGAQGPAGAGTGHGLIGMRERASLLGGSLETSFTLGNFAVCAVLPYNG